MAKSERIAGVNPPERPKVKIKEVAEKYPVAAAYMKADEWVKYADANKAF